jgi:hypothetical protein
MMDDISKAELRAHNRLRQAHERRAKKDGVTLWNHGWVVTNRTWLSKTERGILKTRRLASGRYKHVYLGRV